MKQMRQHRASPLTSSGGTSWGRFAVFAAALACADLAGAQSLTLEIGGTSRRIEIHSPPSGPKPRPLVIVLHGLGKPVTGLRHDLGLDAVATKENLTNRDIDSARETWDFFRPFRSR